MFQLKQWRGCDLGEGERVDEPDDGIIDTINYVYGIGNGTLTR